MSFLPHQPSFCLQREDGHSPPWEVCQSSAAFQQSIYKIRAKGEIISGPRGNRHGASSSNLHPGFASHANVSEGIKTPESNTRKLHWLTIWWIILKKSSEAWSKGDFISSSSSSQWFTCPSSKNTDHLGICSVGFPQIKTAACFFKTLKWFVFVRVETKLLRIQSEIKSKTRDFPPPTEKALISNGLSLSQLLLCFLVLFWCCLNSCDQVNPEQSESKSNQESIRESKSH